MIVLIDFFDKWSPPLSPSTPGSRGGDSPGSRGRGAAFGRISVVFLIVNRFATDQELIILGIAPKSALDPNTVDPSAPRALPVTWAGT